MASEEIKLIGSFKDDITPQLKKLNKQIESIGRSFSKFSRNLRPMSREFGRLAMASREFNEALKSQRSLIQGNANAMRQYKSQAGKMTSAMRNVQSEHQKMMRSQGMSRAEQKRAARRGGGGGRLPGMPAPPVPTVLPRSSKSKKSAPAVSPSTVNPKVIKGAGAQMGNSFAKTVAGSAIGSTIGLMASQAIMGGISKIGNALKMPFDKFGAAFRERMNDEMDDLRSAGGLYALDIDLTQESGNQRLFKNFGDSLRFQEEINVKMAESASSLPGSTSEFVDMNRRMTDTVQMVMEKDRDKFIKLGESLGADTGSQDNVANAKNAFLAVGQTLTEQMMLFKSDGGGLPMDLAMQTLLNAETGKGGKGFKMQSFFNKFRAQFQKNPLLKNFLLRAEGELMAAEAGSAERLEILTEVLRKGMPQQQIDRMRGSLNGMMEALRSGILDPQAGLFGLSRAVTKFDKEGKAIGKVTKRNVDDLGNFLYTVTDVSNLKDKIDPTTGEKIQSGAELTLKQLTNMGLTLGENGKILQEVNGKAREVGEESRSTTYLFEQMREIMANYGAPLVQIVGLLPEIFDPFTKMTEALLPIRDKSVDFFKVFQKANTALEDAVDSLRSSSDSAIKSLGAQLGKQNMARSALYSITNLLGKEGVLSVDRMTELKKILGKIDTSDPKAVKESIAYFDQNKGQIFKELMNGLLKSDFLSEISEAFGVIIGGIMNATFEVIAGLFGMAKSETGSKLMDGFFKGFESQFDGGFDGFMGRVNELFMKVMAEIGKFITTKVIPFLFKSLIQMILGGFKSGPIGMLMSGGLIVALVSGIKFLTTSAWNAAAGLAAAAKSATAFSIGAGRGLIGKAGPMGSAAGSAGMAKGAGLKGFAKQMSNIFMSDVNKLMDKRAANIAKFGQRGGQLKSLSQGLGVKGAISAGLKSGIKMGAVGGIIKSVMGLVEGKSPLDAISEGLASAGGSAIGAAIGTIIFPGIGTAIGAFLGGSIGDMPGVVEGLKQALMAIGDALGGVWESLSSVFASFGDSFSGLINIFSSITGIGGEIDSVTAIVIAVKVALTPIVAAFQLLGQAINLVVLVFHGLKFHITSMLASITGLLSKIPMIGGQFKKVSEELNNQAELSKKQAGDTLNRMGAQFEKDMKFFQTEKVGPKATEEATVALKGMTDAAKAAGSTFENNQKFTGEDGKEYGWAMKEGQKVLVEWGSVAESVKDMVDAATGDFKNSQPSLKTDGVAPSASDKAWYEEMMRNQGTPVTPAPTPTAPVTPAATPASAPTALEIPDLSAPITQVGEATTAVAGSVTKVGEVGAAMQTLTAPVKQVAEASTAAASPLKELGPAAEAGASGMDSFVSAMEAIPPKVDAALVGAASTAGSAISQAAAGLAQALSSAAQSIKNAASASASASAKSDGMKVGTKYGGHTGGQGVGKTMPLAQAIEKEKSMMPSGSELVIANTSETIIPAFNGHISDKFRTAALGQIGDSFKDFTFNQMESAAGFDRMKSYTEQISEIADRTAAEFSGSFDGALGGGSATLNAMEALGHQHGLITTSGFRPGDPGFHGANRARDLSNGGGETPEMNKVAGIMASQFGSSLTELIYTPMGFSIKNGAKTGLISPDNHYHHIHVAVAEGLQKAAVFSSQRAAESYERSMMPSGAEPMKVNLASMTANSSEFSGGGDIHVGDITVNVSGANDPKDIANTVADEILSAMQRASYDELFTN